MRLELCRPIDAGLHAVCGDVARIAVGATGGSQSGVLTATEHPPPTFSPCARPVRCWQVGNLSEGASRRDYSKRRVRQLPSSPLPHTPGRRRLRERAQPRWLAGRGMNRPPRREAPSERLPTCQQRTGRLTLVCMRFAAMSRVSLWARPGVPKAGFSRRRNTPLLHFHRARGRFVVGRLATSPKALHDGTIRSGESGSCRVRPCPTLRAGGVCAKGLSLGGLLAEV